MRSLVFAYHSIGSAAFDELIKQGAEVIGLFTHEDDPRERIWFEPPAVLAAKKNIPIFTPSQVNQSNWIEKIRSLRPDAIFSFYYRHIICSEILTIAPKGSFNLHGSYLPKYRGRAPVNWVLVHGEKETGMSLHYMSARADAGDIVLQKKIPITLEDRAIDLVHKMEDVARQIVREAYPRIRDGNAPRLPQDERLASKFPGRKPEDGRIDWRQTAVQIYNLIRAVTHPYPGAFSYLHGKKCFLWWGKPEGETDGSDPGKISVDAQGFRVSTGKGFLRVLRCQIEGGAECDALDLIQQENIRDGETFAGATRE